MNILEIVKLSIENLFSFKFRSFLTMLGIIMGIAAVVLLSSLGAGFQAKLLDDTKDSINSTLTLEINKKYSGSEVKSSDYIKEADLEKFKNIEGVEDAMVEADVALINVGDSKFVIVNGVKNNYFSIFNKKIFEGSKFLTSSGNVVMISKGTAKKLFAKESPIGKELTLNFRNGNLAGKFKIIGTYNGFFDKSADIFGDTLPLEALMTLETVNSINNNYNKVYQTAIIKIKKGVDLNKEVEIIKKYLKKRGSKEDMYTLKLSNEDLKTVTGILDKFSLFINLVASIAIIVGGIGVMNIMLVSVKERIGEIGLRKAIGARNTDIMYQFLIETMILTIIGGLIGVVLGYSLAMLIGKFIKILPILEMKTLLVSLIISSLTGLIFGIYPAKQASKLSPMEALRKE